MKTQKAPETLQFQTQVLLRELWNGDFIAFPLANRALSTYADTAEECLRQQKRFLQSFLTTIPAEELSRYSLPPDVVFREIPVLLQREDLPRRLRLREPFSIGIAVIPLRRESWVVLLPLEHTLHVSQDEDLEEAVRAEVSRIVSARDLTPAEVLQLLPPRAQRLETVTLSLTLGEDSPEGGGFKLRKELLERERKKQARKVLESVCTPWHSLKEVQHGPPIVGREPELKALRPLLAAKERTSVLLLGSEMVGKSSVLKAWLREEHAAGRQPMVYAASGSRLIAGMSGLGQWQERVSRIMKAAELLDAILYFEDLADLLAEHSSWIDLPGAMKPYLEDNRVRLVAELTPEALDLFETRQSGFLSSLMRVRVPSLKLEAAARALQERIAFWNRREPDRPNLQPEALGQLLELTERYLPYQPLPGKAVRLYEELRAMYRSDLEPDGKPRPITAEKLIQAFSLRTGIPPFLLREDRAMATQELLQRFQKRLVGQSEAVRSIVGTLATVKAGLQPTGKPLATLLFIGPTGVGKTELARLLAEVLFGTTDRMARFDMSEYMDPYAAERLIRGTQSREGLLTRKVREQPFGVLLLDEIEKAHPAVLDLLLQVAGEGRLTDARGRTAYFHNTILILTSNLGAAHRRTPIGLGQARRTDAQHYLRQVQQEFRPEFVNRLDRILVFHPLSAPEVREVAAASLQKLTERRGLAEAGIVLELAPGMLDSLAGAGYSEAYGARAMRRHLETHLVAPLGRYLSRLGAEAHGRKVIASPGPEFKAEQKPLKQKDWTRAQKMTQLSHLRRQVNRWMALDPIEALSEQLAFLGAQLNARKQRGVEDRRLAQQRAEIQREQHRLRQLWETATALRTELEELEELGLTALFEDEDTAPFLDEANRVETRFRAHLVTMLMALDPKRNGITLLLYEHDEQRGFAYWLLPLLEEARQRGWVLQFHIDGDEDPNIPKPFDLRWGPPRSSNWMLDRLLQPERPFRSLLLRASGEMVGALLSLEAGLHRWVPENPDDPRIHLQVTLVTLRSELTPKELARPEIGPPYPTSLQVLQATPPVREHLLATGQLWLLGGRRSLDPAPRDYWKQFETVALEHLLASEEDPELDRTERQVGLLDRIRPGELP